jgi:hypothetical protein
MSHAIEERAMAMYESEHTRFMRELMAKQPELAQKQKEGRAIWWDKVPNLDEERRQEASEVAMPAYVYQNKVSDGF